MPYAKLCSSDISTLCSNSDAHAQRIMGNGVVIAAPLESDCQSLVLTNAGK
jgi:hypothetical protein